MAIQHNVYITEIITTDVLFKIGSTKKFVVNFSSSAIEIMINDLFLVQDKITQQEAKEISKTRTSYRNTVKIRTILNHIKDR